MELITQLENCTDIFCVKEQLYINDQAKKQILNNNLAECYKYDDYCRFWYDNSFIYLIKNGEFKIFDSDFNLYSIIENELITLDGSTLIFFESKDYFISNSVFDKIQRKLLRNEIVNLDRNIYKRDNFWGRVLTNLFRLNFPEGIISNPTTFSCSDLLTESIYWEYDCGEGYQADRFYVWGENLVFVKGGEKGAILLVIELITGKIIWETEIPHGAFNFDEERGLLVSVWGNEYVGDNYQIISLGNQTVENGKITWEYPFENVNVHWQQQYIYKNKLYFTDNIRSYGNDWRPVKFGCFDIETKEVEFMQELSVLATAISQVIFNENKLYLRTENNELFIYEDEKLEV